MTRDGGGAAATAQSEELVMGNEWNRIGDWTEECSRKKSWLT